MLHDERETAIVRVIRGEMPLLALEDSPLAPLCASAHPPREALLDARVQITIQDIARGFMAYRAQPEERYRWAWALLSWDFIEIEAHECWRDPASVGGAVLSALWNAAYHLPLDTETIDTVAQITAGRCPVSARPA